MRAVCRLPNAGALINGVRFEAGPDGLVSEPLGEEDAKRFGSIPGYQIVYDAVATDLVPAEPIDVKPAPMRAKRKVNDATTQSGNPA